MAELIEFIQSTDRLVSLDARFKTDNQTIGSLTIFKNKVQQLWEDVDVAYDVYMSLRPTEETEANQTERESVREKYSATFKTYALLLGQIETLLHRMRAEERLTEPEAPPATQDHLDTICQNAVNSGAVAASPKPPTLHLPNANVSMREDKSQASNMQTPIDPFANLARLNELTGLRVPDDRYSHNIPLPPCEIEVFKGTYAAWPSFRDMFNAIVIRNSRLSNVERLFHLRSKTVGEAHDIVTRVPLTHDGFDVAWQALSATYENKRVLVNSQLKKLFNLPIITRETSQGIKQLVREICSALQILNMHTISTDNWDPINVFLRCQRLPDAAIALFEQSLLEKTSLPSWNDLKSFLTTRVLTLEAIAETRNSSLTAPRPPQMANRPLRTHLVQSEEAHTSSTSSREAAKTCPLCPREKHHVRANYTQQ